MFEVTVVTYMRLAKAGLRAFLLSIWVLFYSILYIFYIYHTIPTYLPCLPTNLSIIHTHDLSGPASSLPICLLHIFPLI